MAKFIDNAEVSNLKYNKELNILYCDKCNNAIATSTGRTVMACPGCKLPINRVENFPESIIFDENLIKF